MRGWVHAPNYDTACGSCGLTAPLHVSTAVPQLPLTSIYVCVDYLLTKVVYTDYTGIDGIGDAKYRY
jgi:hypothetical protein